MRPGDFYELSRYLALRLEEAIQGGSGESLIPVFLAHPVDIPKAESGQGPRAACTGSFPPRPIVKRGYGFSLLLTRLCPAGCAGALSGWSCALSS
jgi:hypothetical protein